MTASELIATHSNTDFDAFAAMVAAHKLYPEAAVVLGGAVNRNVREFQTLFNDEIPVVEPAEVDLAAVTRLVLVDTVHPNRLGELAPLCGRDGVEVVVFDHHAPSGEPLDFVRPTNLIRSDDGSLVTLILRIIAERGIEVTPLEATVFALGIHEDTGSLTFPTTTVRDAEALAFCMRRGANQQLVERFLHNPLTGPQRDLLVSVLEEARPVQAGGFDVLVSAVSGDQYVEGISLVVHKALDLTNADGFVLLVEMEHRVFVTARSRVETLDMARVLKASVGGGGHAAAASAIVKDSGLEDARTRVEHALALEPLEAPSAATLMSQPVHWVTIATTVDEAIVLCERYGYGGLSVADDDTLVGSVSRRDLDRAARHRLGHAPVKAVMTTTATVVSADTPLEELTTALARDPVGRLPVVRDGAAGPVRREDVIGVVTRSDLLQALHTGGEPRRSGDGPDVRDQLAALGLDDLFAHVQAVAANFRGAYLVGGAVRDLLLEHRLEDIDVAVEGDGIEFARALAERLGGRVRPHPKFQTAVIVLPGDVAGGHRRLDVASTRTEFYDYPAALPKVEHATIRGDLSRRDFSINAMAVSLNARDFGTLLDYFGGIGDLGRRQLVVLHNLSFIEDPTRILRAVRYENRYDFRMDRHTLALARACVEMDLIGDLSSARLRDELVLLFDEARVSFTLHRLAELGLEPTLHPRVALGAGTQRLVAAADGVRLACGLESEVPAWRLRLIVLLRDITPEEMGDWTARLKFRRRDAEVLIRSALMGARIARRLRRQIKEADLYDLLHGEPLEAVVLATALSAGTPAAERLERYLTHTRHVRLAIGGRDLLAIGYRESAALGDVLSSVLHLKLNGVVSGKRQELEAARRMAKGR
jgi:tRNA nucleotidyltransferase (CCA-adding enzyme)